MKTLSLALQRGVRFEICYAPGILATDGGASRRNLISNATQLIRATRGKGIIISSEAQKSLACRGPWDVINLAAVWGLGQEKGTEAVGRESRNVIMQAQLKRRSFKGVIDVVYGGDKPEPTKKEVIQDGKGKGSKNKRKADVLEVENGIEEDSAKPISKRQQKRLAKEARLGNAEGQGLVKEQDPNKIPLQPSLVSTNSIDKNA